MLGFFSFFAVHLIGCDSDEAVKVHNSAPTATISSHSAGTEFMDGVVVTLIGQVADDNHSNSELQVKWSSDQRELCPSATPDFDGMTFCQIAFQEGESAVRLQVVDPKGETAIDELSIVVAPTDAPVVQIVSPTADGAYYSDQLILFSAVLQDNEDEPSELRYTWTSSIDGELAVTAEPESSGEIEQYLHLSAGQHAISLEVEDQAGKLTTETVAITVGGDNNEPQCEITGPADGATYVLGQNISFAGLATDDDINNSLLTIAWESDQDGVFNTTMADTGGEIGFTDNSLSAGNHTIFLRVEDEVGGLCTDSIQLQVGEAPVVTLTDPADGSVFSVGEVITFAATIADQEDVLADISLSWESDIDGVLSTQAANSDGTVAFTKSNLSAGLHNLTLTATDSMGLFSSVAFSLRVNTPPGAPSITLAPDPAYVNDSLLVTSNTAMDSDGDMVSLSYEWLQNGNVTSYTAAALPSAATTAGELWTVRVTPNDGYTDGDYSEASITISNSLPNVDSVSISPSNVTRDDTLTCSATASDADQSLSATYTWSVDGQSYSGASLDLSNIGVMPNTQITCTAEVVDDAGASANASTSVTVTNRSPQVTAVTITPATAYSNSQLMCTASVSDADGETPSEDVQWTNAGVVIGSGSSLQLDSTAVVVGDTVTCTVSASDAYGGTASADASVGIDNSNPTVDALAFDLQQPTTADTLTCTAQASDIDSGSVSLAFTWTNQTTGEVYPSTSSDAQSASLDLTVTSISADDVLGCSVVASDSNGGTASQATTVAIVNSGPSFTVAPSITPNSGVYTGTTLVCSATAFDVSDGNLQPTYEWSVNGNSVASGPAYTINAADTTVGDTILCQATATDSDGESISGSASVVISNSIPVMANTVITPSSSVYNDTELSCSATVTDPDEVLTIDYAWLLNGSPVGTGSTLDLATTGATPNDTVTCVSSANDALGATDSEQVQVSIDNRLPTTPVVSVSPLTPREGLDDLVCQLDQVSTDDDGDSITYEYSWTQNGASTAYTSDTIAASLLVDGDDWSCTVTPSDGYGYGSSASASATVGPASSPGDSESNPGVTCLDIHNQNSALGSGVYWIDPQGSGNAFQVYCEMTIDGGGWTVQSYLRDTSQWDWTVHSDNGTVGDTVNGFSSGISLLYGNFQVYEKIVIYLRIIEDGADIGTQWMVNSRANPVGYGNLPNESNGWSYYDSYGSTSPDAGSVCTHGCYTYRGCGMFHSSNGIGYHGTQGGDYGCSDGNNICWTERSPGCNVGSSRCSMLSGSDEGVIYAVR